MLPDGFDREQVECACVAISKTLRELLRERKIDALEFLSLVRHLPIQLADLTPDKWQL